MLLQPEDKFVIFVPFRTVVVTTKKRELALAIKSVTIKNAPDLLTV